MTSNYEQDLVKITHYINPHMFWYKYEDTILNNVELTEWETSLNEYFSNYRPPTLAHNTAKLNEIVAVYNFSLNRWIRAKCMEIVQFMIANTKYVMWAIDYGIPFQTEAKWINKIPSKLGAQPEETVFFGGISHVVPAEKEFNFETFESEIKPSMKWSTLAVRTIENLINEAAHIRFVRHLISREGQFFGNLEFLTYTNQIMKADSSLVEINHAIRTNDFLRIIRQIKTNEIPIWKTNDNASFVSKYNINKISNIERVAALDGHYVDEEVSRKVSDWTQRNIQCQNDDRRSVIDDAASICESVISMQISRKIATENLLVETDECVDEAKQCPVVSRFSNSKESNSDNTESSRSNTPMEQLSTANDKDSSTEGTVVNTVINAPVTARSESESSSNTETGRTVDTMSNAMKLVMHRLHMKRRKMDSLKAQRKPPQNAIPAGFDLRNLQGSRMSVVSDAAPYPDFIGKFRKVNRY